MDAPEIEETPKRHNLKKFWISLGVFFVLAITTLIILSIPRLKTNGFKGEIDIEYGSDFVVGNDDFCYGNIFYCDAVEKTFSGTVDTLALGDYEINYSIKHGDENFELKQTVHVVDRTAPEITVVDEQVSLCPNGKIQPIKFTAIDNIDGDVAQTAEIIKSDDSQKVVIKAKDLSGNVSEQEIKNVVVEDITAPTISFSDDIYYVEIGKYTAPEEPTIIDNCDAELQIEKTGEVNAEKSGTYEISYTATDQSGNTTAKTQTVIVNTKNTGVIYLTFDDGPSEHTYRLLDILAKHNVKATFFVTGSGDDAAIKREYDEGHSVALHSASHAYDYIYRDDTSYFADLDTIRNRVEKITGFSPKLIRFPGGSSNTVSRKYDGGTHIMSYLASEVQKRGYTYFDWNISSGDAGGANTSSQVCNNVTSALVRNKNFIVLQHDNKGFSVDAVECIIDFGKRNGYRFDKLSANSPTMRHKISN